MKRFSKFAALALCACVALGMTACGEKEEVVIWGAQEDQALLRSLVEEFKAQNPDVKEDIRVEVQSVQYAQSVVDKDPDKAADVIMIPHDQLGYMAKTGLIAEIRDGTSATFASDIRNNNAESAVQQATYDGKVYGFPVTMDTYILYYTTDIFPDAPGMDKFLGSVDAMLAQDMPNIQGSKEKAIAFGYNIGDGFYLNAGFFAVGCTLYGENGDDVSACNWNNEQGMKFMRYAAKNFRQSGGKFRADDAKNMATAVLNGRLGACISGGWEMFDTFLGAENIKYRTLPSITIDGEELPLKPFSNSKQYVINNMSKHKATASRLAAFVTSESAQLRFVKERGYYPANLNAQNDPSVTENDFFQVIKAQLEDSVPVPVIPEISRYWEPAKKLGSSIYNGSLAGDDASLQAALETFIEGLSGTL